MDILSLSINRAASLSVNSLLARERLRGERGDKGPGGMEWRSGSRDSFLRPPAASRSLEPEPGASPVELSHLRIESPAPELVEQRIGDMKEPGEFIRKIGRNFLSARLKPKNVRKLLEVPHIAHVDTKKQTNLHLTEVLSSIGLVPSQSAVRCVREDGSGILIGIIDSGFDLSHPAFWDRERRHLRVEAMWDQLGGGFEGKEYDTAALEAAWGANDHGPGGDRHGHGTHVASIAGGTEHRGYEGIAPGARFLLVRGNFVENEDAASWIVRKAAGRPCVINLSYGHHWGAHDGTDGEERFHADDLAGPGTIVVVSAGNERSRGVHVAGQFSDGQRGDARFDIQRTGPGNLRAVLTAWYDCRDEFSAALVSPGGKEYVLPQRGAEGVAYRDPGDGKGREFVEVYHGDYAWSRSVEMLISIELSDSENVPTAELEGWTLRLRCERASGGGRIDAWVAQDGTAKFTGTPEMPVDDRATIGIPATGGGSLSAGSYVCRRTWESDDGSQSDATAEPNCPSNFSSMGPTRNGALKPEVSCPGQYVTAALASKCRLADWTKRSRVDSRLLTLEGTSMSAPVLAGTVALMLQKQNSLTAERIREILRRTAIKDDKMNGADWHEALGYGRLNALGTLLAVV